MPWFQVLVSGKVVNSVSLRMAYFTTDNSSMHLSKNISKALTNSMKTTWYVSSSLQLFHTSRTLHFFSLHLNDALKRKVLHDTSWSDMKINGCRPSKARQNEPKRASAKLHEMPSMHPSPSDWIYTGIEKGIQFVFTNRHLSSWWFQPIWKILVKLDHFPK